MTVDVFNVYPQIFNPVEPPPGGLIGSLYWQLPILSLVNDHIRPKITGFETILLFILLELAHKPFLAQAIAIKKD